MGIKSNYTKCIRGIAGNDIYEPVHISKFAYQKIAIDTTLFLYKFKAAMGESNWITGFLNLVRCIRSNMVHPVFIFDGKPPIEKAKEQQARRDDRDKLATSNQILEDDIDTYKRSGEISEKLKKLAGEGEFDINAIEAKMEKKHDQVVHIGREDFNTLKDLFTSMKIPFYDAPDEAEKLCSKLCIDGHVQAVLSDDTDVIAYGTPITINKLNTSSGGCFTIHHETLRARMGLTKEQFTDHCIMCGTDYNKNIPGVGSVLAYRHIKNHGSIEGFRDATDTNVDILDHVTVRRLFTEFAPWPEGNAYVDIPYSGYPDPDELQRFFHANSVHYNCNYFLARIENRYLQMITE
jgi:5'-3' exonuclease